MFSKKDIILQLENMGAPKDKMVIVHTSMKAVGEVEGRAQGFLDALIEYFTSEGGVLCIPTHTWGNFYGGKEIALDENSPKTCVGVLCDTAAADRRAIRTLSNPTHSLALFGDKSKVERLVKKESAVNTPTSPKGCYGEIFEGGYVLLIGVGHDKNTALHCVEEMIPVPNRLSKEPAIMNVIDKNGQIKKREFLYMYAEGNDDVSQFFPKYEPAFRYHDGIKDGVIGNAKAQLCNAEIMKKVMYTVFNRSGGVELLFDDIPLKEEWYK